MHYGKFNMYYLMQRFQNDFEQQSQYEKILIFILIIFKGPGGTPRPIELHSHDPLRYVGDMLAWLHQAAASEKEYVHSLFKKCAGGKSK